MTTGMFWMMSTSALLEPSSQLSGLPLKLFISTSTVANLMSGHLVSTFGGAGFNTMGNLFFLTLILKICCSTSIVFL
jgi:hypothetical protein